MNPLLAPLTHDPLPHDLITQGFVVHDLVALLVVTQLAAPVATLALIGLPALLGRPLSERLTTRLVGTGFTIAFSAGLVIFAVLAGRRFVPEIVHLGTWFSVGHHAATIDLVADGLSVPYVCFSTGLCALVNAFAVQRREGGPPRIHHLPQLRRGAADGGRRRAPRRRLRRF